MVPPRPSPTLLGNVEVFFSCCLVLVGLAAIIFRQIEVNRGELETKQKSKFCEKVSSRRSAKNHHFRLFMLAD